MTAIPNSGSPAAAQALARITAVVAGMAVVTSVTLIFVTGSIEVAFFSVFAAVGGAYSAQVGWRKS